MNLEAYVFGFTSKRNSETSLGFIVLKNASDNELKAKVTMLLKE